MWLQLLSFRRWGITCTRVFLQYTRRITNRLTTGATKVAVLGSIHRLVVITRELYASMQVMVLFKVLSYVPVFLCAHAAWEVANSATAWSIGDIGTVDEE